VNSTLTWQSSDGVASATVEHRGRDAYDGKTIVAWSLTLAEPGEAPITVAAGDDMRCPEDSTLWDNLGALSSFLGAWHEAWHYPNSENGNLFPDSARPWVEHYSEELYADIWRDVE
jgi:hypothetical protein